MTLQVGQTLRLIGWLIGCAILTAQVPLSAFAIPSQFYSGNDVLYYTDGVPCTEGDSAESSPGGDTPGSVAVPKDFTLGSDKSKRPVNLVKQLMQDFNLKDFQAAGIVGNFMHESGGKDLPPNINEYVSGGGGPGPPRFIGGYGWAQWTAGRQTTFIDYAVENGYMKSRSVDATDAANYAYLAFEVTETAESKAIPAVKQSTDVTDAVTTWEDVFERAGKPILGERIKDGKEVLAAYKSGGGVDIDGSTDGSSQGSDSSEEESQGCQMPDSTSPTSASGTFGQVAFPLKGPKSTLQNPEGLNTCTDASKGCHPYIAYDLLAKAGTQVVGFADGTVTSLHGDLSPSGLAQGVSVFNEKSGLVVYYTHMASISVKEGDKISPGDKIGTLASVDVFPAINADHLHIDASTGNVRGSCSRSSCPIQDQFRDISDDLKSTYEKLP